MSYIGCSYSILHVSETLFMFSSSLALYAVLCVISKSFFHLLFNPSVDFYISLNYI